MVTQSLSPGPRTPAGSQAPGDLLPPAVPDTDPNSRMTPAPRRGSFNFLRRGKSVERLNSQRNTSGGKLSKRQIQRDREAEMARQEREAAAAKFTVLPDIAHPPQLQTFGGDIAHSNDPNQNRFLPKGAVDMTRSNIPKIPVPPIPGLRNASGEYVDPYPRTLSMTHRGRNSYASSLTSTVNSPRRVRRRKDPIPFNVLVVGARNSGKTSFLEFLKTSLAMPAKKQQQTRDGHHDKPQYPIRVSPTFKAHYLEIELDEERIGLTLWDSEGLDANIVDLQLREMASFVESKFEETFNEEQKVVRSPGVQDTHIHCVFLLLDPVRLDQNVAASKKAKEASNAAWTNGNSYLHPSTPNSPGGLNEDLDLQALRILQGKTIVIPIISKADTITTTHMLQLKRVVWDSIKQANLDPLEALGLDDADEDDDSSNDIETPVTSKHKKHDSKRFDERDEDEALLQAPAPQYASNNNPDRSRSMTSQLDSASDLSSDSISQKLPIHTRHSNSSATYPTQTTDSSPSAPYLPLSILSPDLSAPHVLGRQFPWGMADPYNAEHCDFIRLKDAVFKEWRGELREASRELWYESWRTTRLNAGFAGGGRKTGRQEKRMGRGDPRNIGDNGDAVAVVGEDEVGIAR